MKPAIPLLIFLHLAAGLGVGRAENPCRLEAFLELARKDPDSLTNRQFVNLLKYRERCEEYNAEKLTKLKKNLEDDDLELVIRGAILFGFVLLAITSFRF